MALSGELSDLSLAELIEFFCNQRKTGRLKVIYPHLPGYFYIQAGALVDARVGSLSGVDAIYYALTLPNASFKFETEREAEQRTIHQPWTQVILEGLRRMDEGIAPESPINKEELPDENDLEEAFESVIHETDQSATPLPMSLTVDSMARGGAGKRRKLLVAVAAAVLVVAVTATLVFAKGLAQTESTASIPPVALHDAEENTSNQPATTDAAQETAADPSSVQGAGAPAGDASALALRREQEARERRRAEEMNSAWPAMKSEPAATTTTPTAVSSSAPAPSATPAAAAVKKPDAPKPGPKTVTVQVTYDEAGRVTQASGSDPTALRIARQKRFPSGKPGTTTITIPIN